MRVMQRFADHVGCFGERLGNGDLDSVCDGRWRLVLRGKPQRHDQFEGVRSVVGYFTHSASSAAPHTLAADIFFPENLCQRVPSADAMQEEKGIAEIALSGGIRADEDRERTQFESGILEVLESF